MRPTSMTSILVFGAVALLGACAPDATAPEMGAPAARAAKAAAGSDYLVLFSSNAVPADFSARVRALGGTVTSSHAGAGIAAVSRLDAAGAASLAASADVSEVEPDVRIALEQPAQTAVAAVGPVAATSQGNPTTASRYAWQWNMRAIHADQAWAAGDLGSSDVTVAILDTGIDYDAYDLNGLVDLSRSVSLVPSDDQLTAKYFPTRSVISDYNGHGTNVATQVSSKALALAGVTSRTTLLGVKVLDAAGSGDLGWILNGVLWAADHGADVANMSLGGGFAKSGLGVYVGFINRVFNYAARKGVLIVVAAGNESADLDHDGNTLVTFCGEPQVLCVSAAGPTTWAGSPDAFSFYSNYGRSAIDVAGPGGNGQATTTVWPWGPDNYSWVWSFCSKTLIAGFGKKGVPVLPCAAGNLILGYIGTSQATPHVAGLAALLVAELGHGHAAQIRELIMQSADDLGQSGTDPLYGRGRINVARAVGL